ncbi:MAG: hypothetical protein E7211_19710 [Clostridium lundense]|nr:hypothetical protein [Clostridium lundense]
MNNDLYRYEPELLQALHDAETAAVSIRRVATSALLNSPYRSLPGAACGDHPIAARIEETQEGWLCLTLPVMLPHRKKDDKARFLIEPIYAAARAYYDGRPMPRFAHCVIAYEHIYARGTQRRHVTDHDNLELKHCQDAIESLFLTNDSAHYCAAFQCSHEGGTAATRI